MTAPKKPQDHKEPESEKPKATDVEGGRSVTFPKLTLMEKGKKVPLSVFVSDDAINDFELLDDLRSLDVDSNAARLPAILRRLISDAQYAIVMDVLRDPKTKRVSIADGSTFIKDLFGAINPN